MPIALIPARGGSRRIPKKNIKLLRGHPLIAYTIRAALASSVMDRVVVSTDDAEIAEVARAYGADVPFIRPREFGTDDSPDIEWITHALTALGDASDGIFWKLRATNPLRSVATLVRAWQQFSDADAEFDSLRSVQTCAEHPGRMWTIHGGCLSPLLAFHSEGVPWYGLPYHRLPEVVVQNGAIEIFRADVIRRGEGTAGHRVAAFEMSPLEGFDINTPLEWQVLEGLIEAGEAILPDISRPAG